MTEPAKKIQVYQPASTRNRDEKSEMIKLLADKRKKYGKNVASKNKEKIDRQKNSPSSSRSLSRSRSSPGRFNSRGRKHM